MSRIALLADIAEREIGTKEEGNNGGAKIRAYQAATTLTPAAWPWCAAFVAWCLNQWLVNNFPYVARSEHDSPRLWSCRSARAFDWEAWAAKNPRILLLDEWQPVKRGDIVTFDFSHIGIVTAPSEAGPVFTVEGNTGPDGEREGDGVYAKRRKRSLIRRVIRITTDEG